MQEPEEGVSFGLLLGFGPSGDLWDASVTVEVRASGGVVVEVDDFTEDGIDAEALEAWAASCRPGDWPAPPAGWRFDVLELQGVGHA